MASVCKRRSGSESLAKLQLAEEKPLLNGLILNHSNIRLSFQRLVAMVSLNTYTSVFVFSVVLTILLILLKLKVEGRRTVISE